MEAHQEVRLKQAEAADQREAANRDTFAEPTREYYQLHLGGCPDRIRPISQEKPWFEGAWVATCEGLLDRNDLLWLFIAYAHSRTGYPTLKTCAAYH
jgi:hypothetical protein